MRRPITLLLVAAACAAGALACWAVARRAEQLAMTHERLATLQPTTDAPTARGTWSDRLLQTTLARLGVSDDHASIAAQYWSARYDAIAGSEAAADAGPSLLLVAANAHYRRAQREAGGRAPSVERLDATLQAYAAVLKNGGFVRDAAYNYEFVARLRDSIARTRGGSPRPAAPRAGLRPDDLPQGPTIHGRPGTHPPNSRGEEFEVLTPMDYGEREAQPEPTPGRPMPRKG